MTTGFDRGAVCVVGGGIVGLSCALDLLRRGFDVTVVDADVSRQAASWGNAGHIAIEQVEPLASRAAIRSAPGRLFSRGGALALPAGQVRRWAPFVFRMIAASRPDRFAAGKAALTALSAEAMPAWRRLVDTLSAEDLLREDGHLLVWGTADATHAGRAHWAVADTGGARLEDATAADIASLTAATGIAPGGAMRMRGTGQIGDLAALADALEETFRAAGGRLLRGWARVERDGDRASVVFVDGARTTPDMMVVAAGARSAGLLAPFGYRVPLIAERGYHIRSRDHDWPATMPPVVFEDRSMIVTRYAGCLQAASFVEFGDVDAPPDPVKWERLERHVRELGLPMRGPFVRWMGARPTLPDYLPAIGRSDWVANLSYAFGHQHLGLTLAPITGEIVGALVTGETPKIAIAAFDIQRFSRKKRV